MDAIEQRLASLETRLSMIERVLNLSTTPKSAHAPSKPQTPSAAMAAPVMSNAQPGNWLGIVAIACFVLAAGFIVKLSIDSGWLTPMRQIGMAYMLGLGLIGTGFLLLESDREYASLLPAGGIIVLYVTSFAAYRYYDLIPFEMALALVGIISLGCIGLYLRLRHDIYAITAAVGAYVAPAILGLHTGNSFSLYYFLMCSVAFSAISVWVESRLLTLLSAYLAIIMTALIGFDIGQDLLVTITLALHFFIFSVGTYLYSVHNNTPLRQEETFGFLPVLLIFYAAEYNFIEHLQPGLAPWISIGFAGVLIGLYLMARSYFPDRSGSLTLVLLFSTLVFCHSVYWELMPELMRPWLLVVITLGAGFISYDISDSRKDMLYRIPILAVLGIAALEYIAVISHLWAGEDAYWLLVAVAAFASFWAVLLFGGGECARNQSCGNILLGAAHILAILGLYRLTHFIGSLAVSSAWLLYAVAVTVVAFSRKDETMARSALFVLGFAAAKALLYDAASAPTIIRIFCLLLTGVVLYSCGLLMRKIAWWNRPGQ